MTSIADQVNPFLNKQKENSPDLKRHGCTFIPSVELFVFVFEDGSGEFFYTLIVFSTGMGQQV